MSKSVKTIVQVASIAALAYGGYAAYQGMAAAGTGASAGSAALASKAPAAAAQSGVGAFTGGAGGASTVGASAFTGESAGIGAALKAAGKGLLESKAISAGSLGMQGLGQMQQQAAMDEAKDAEKRQAEIQSRINEAEAQKARIQMIRQQRVLAGRTEASAAGRGFSPSGTSSIVTGLGSLNTQTAVASADITGRAETARNQGEAQSAMYSAVNEAQGWKAFSDLGSDVFKNSGAIKNLFA